MYALLQTRGRAGKVYHTAHGAHLHTHRLLLELFKAAAQGFGKRLFRGGRQNSLSRSPQASLPGVAPKQPSKQRLFIVGNSTKPSSGQRRAHTHYCTRTLSRFLCVCSVVRFPEVFYFLENGRTCVASRTALHCSVSLVHAR